MSVDTMAVPAYGTEPQLRSPPDSNKDSPHTHKLDGSDSELSDLEEEDDIGTIEPDHYSDDGVPVFKPSMNQFKSFKLYMSKVNPYGMKSGIVKVIPPSEWHDKLPRLDEAIKNVRVKEPIKQDIMGTSGTYRQANILHQRSYNLPQWRQLCEQSEHQPPAKRGERRANQDKAPRPKTKVTSTSVSSGGKRKGRSTKSKSKAAVLEAEDGTGTPDRLPTPESPAKVEDDTESFKHNLDDEDETAIKPKGGRQPKSISVSSRRKYNRREAAAKIDEEAFKDFRYELEGADYSKERCEELERAYWKTLTYAPPLYGADMPGSLFDDQTTTWNLGKLENLLDVLGTKIPGVNTAYLYLGMWKSTFAWHLEDVDLYSINYLHFGAPKQWYSISQGDARRFEAAMKSIWPTDAKACDQFLRHKTFLISPSHLLQNFNIKVNKIVHYPGEFVITFPYGYHSGYNTGYNCAEAVNFALDSWMEYGRVAKKCDCDQAQDSVWIDIREIERKLRGEETDYEETDEEDEEEDDNGPTDLPTPPESSGDTKPKAPKRKRKRPPHERGGETSNVKRIRVRIKAPSREPCILCPNDIPSEPLLLTEEGQKAHRLCALYIPETSIESGEVEKIVDTKYIDKARLELKCNYCRSKKGACFQCSQKKCTRAYHATCAAAAGVLVEQGEIPVFGEDGTEYKEWGIEFSCRFHRSKRDKKFDSDALGDNDRIRKAAMELKKGQSCQMQYYKGDIFAGAVVENRKSEEMLLLDILPRGARVEVEYKWLLIPDPADFRLAKPSANAIPMPKSRLAKESLNTTKRLADDAPRADDTFGEGLTWSEFKCEKIARNSSQVKIDFKKENQMWFYLGKNSTEAKAQFTEDLARPRHNPKGHFLDTVAKSVITIPRQSYGASYPSNNIHQNALNNARVANATRPQQPPKQQTPTVSMSKSEKPYMYKPRDGSEAYRVDPQALQSQQTFLQRSAPYSFGTDPRFRPADAPTTPLTPTTPYSAYPASTPQQVQRPAQISLYQNANQPQLASQAQRPAQVQVHQQANQPQVGSQAPRPAQLATQQHVNQPQANQQTYQPPLRQQVQQAQVPQQMHQPQIPQQVQHQSPISQQVTQLQRPQSSRSPLAPPPGFSRPPYTPVPYTPPVQPPKANNPFSSRSQGPRQSVFSKYLYLQKEHNRSPLEYKSPYRPGGGFMNGYQGDTEHHLKQTLFKSCSGPVQMLANPLQAHGNDSRLYTPSQLYKASPPLSNGAYSSLKHQMPISLPPSTLPPVPKPTTPSTSQLHPAIRQDYNSMSHNQYQTPPMGSYPTQPTHHSPLAPPPQYYQQPFPQAPPLNSASPRTPSFSQNPQLYQQTGNSQPYQSYQLQPQPQPQYHSHTQPQYQEKGVVYEHQQFFQKVQAQAPAMQASLSQPHSQNRGHAYSDFPDVPADSTSLIERMMMNLRKATSSSAS